MYEKVLIIVFSLLLKLSIASNYCKLCENGTHTLCRYQEGPSKLCSNYRKVEITEELKKYIVDIHNDIRNHVASGQELKGKLGSQPPAADMFLLEWDDELALIAQRWADQCVSVNATVQHDICKITERFPVGQNILTAITSDSGLPELSILILNWYRQVVNVIPSDINYFSGIKRGQYLIGQYTQLVWSKTKYVGCGLAIFREPNNRNNYYNHRLVCNYGPGGNSIGQPIYQRGPPCSKCLYKRCDPVRTNLCQGPQNAKTNTVSSNMPPFNVSFTFDVVNEMTDPLCLISDDFYQLEEYRKCLHVMENGRKLKKPNNVEEFNSRKDNDNEIASKRVSSIHSTVSNAAENNDNQNVGVVVDLMQSIELMVHDAEVYNLGANFINTLYKLEKDKVVVEKSRKQDNVGYRKLDAIGQAIIISEDEVVFPNKVHFKKAKGKWQDGHCRCDRIYRSASSIVKYKLFLLSIMVCFSTYN